MCSVAGAGAPCPEEEGPPMPDTQNLSSAAVAGTARELVGTPLGEHRLAAVAALLGALTSEMAPMRAMEIPDVEPVTIYDAREP